MSTMTQWSTAPLAGHSFLLCPWNQSELSMFTVGPLYYSPLPCMNYFGRKMAVTCQRNAKYNVIGWKLLPYFLAVKRR